MKKIALFFVLISLLFTGVSFAADLRGSYDLGNGYTVLLGICVTSPCYDNELIVRDSQGAYVLTGWHWAEIPCATGPCGNILVWDAYGTEVGEFVVTPGRIEMITRSAQ